MSVPCSRARRSESAPGSPVGAAGPIEAAGLWPKTLARVATPPRPAPSVAMAVSRRNRRREMVFMQGPPRWCAGSLTRGRRRGALSGDDLEGLHHAEVLVGQDMAVVDVSPGEVG